MVFINHGTCNVVFFYNVKQIVQSFAMSFAKKKLRGNHSKFQTKFQQNKDDKLFDQQRMRFRKKSDQRETSKLI